MTDRGRTATALMGAIGLGAVAGLLGAGGGADHATSQDVSIESIRGIEGIDTIPLQNLEAVLRMQSRPEEQNSQGGAGTAASLMRMETTEKDDAKQPDTRQDMTDLEGS